MEKVIRQFGSVSQLLHICQLNIHEASLQSHHILLLY